MKKSLVKTSNLQKYENSTLPELSDLLDELSEIQKSGKGDKSTDKEISTVRLAIQQRQRTIKARVMEFERTNDHYLVFFASTNGFVKIAGHSALFFVNTIANRLHWRYSLKIDSDRYSVSEDGVISFRSLDHIGLRLAEIDIFPDESLSDSELHFFTLPKVYTDEQIGKLRDQTQDDIKQIMNIVLPTSPIPSLYDAIMQASQIIYYQFKHLSDGLAKDTIGERMIMMTYEMAEEYSFYAHAKPKDSAIHLLNIVRLARKLHYGLAYASKMQILHHREARKALEALVAAERIARRAYLKQEPKPSAK